MKWDSHILYNIPFREAAFVECVVDLSCVHESVEEETGVSIEGGEEVFECITAAPKCTPVVAEKVIHQGYCFGDRACVSADDFLGVLVEPRVLSAGEALEIYSLADSIRHPPSTDDTEIFGKQNSIEVLAGTWEVGKVLDFVYRFGYASYWVISQLNVGLSL